MNGKNFRKLLLLSVFITGSLTALYSQMLPSKDQILEKMVLANKYFMDKWPDPGKEIVTNKTRPSNIWTRAVYYEGLMALYRIDPQPLYLDYALQWGESHHWGLNGGVHTRNADNLCCGQTYIDLYLLDTTKKERIHDIKMSVDNMLASTKIDDWWWIDALQMGMPVFARLGVIYHQPEYFERMYEMYKYTKTIQGGKGLYNPKDRLWWRDKDFVPPYKEPNGEDCYWSRGNGWVVAALVRVLDILPENAPHRKEYVKIFKQMVKAVVPLQRTDGLWNVSLHDSTHFGGKEISGSSLFIYGMAWGVNHGILDRAKYKPVIVKAWNTMVKEALHPDGFLGYVQGTGQEPKDGQPVNYNHAPDFEDYGLGCFLLAGSEIYRMK